MTDNKQEALKELRDALTADYDAAPYMKDKIGNAIDLLEADDSGGSGE